MTKRKPATTEREDVAEARAILRALKRRKDDNWQEWKDRIWEIMHRGLCDVVPWHPPLILVAPNFSNAGMACLEQYMFRSKNEQRCIECGVAGVHKQKSVLIQVVDVYWFCDDCNQYWEGKGES